MFNWPLVYNTYQDVKNNLVYWTVVLLMLATAIVYFLFLDMIQKTAVNDAISHLGTNGLIATIVGVLVFVAYFILAYVLVYGIQIHDSVYDTFIIKWRERYDVEFIITRLTEPFRQDLPANFADFALRYRKKFMNPYYEFVGDGKKGIEQNTRVRFYERVSWYWATQLNEVFILTFLFLTPIFVLASSGGAFTISRLAVFMLALIILGLINRWLIRITSRATTQATLEEIEEILMRAENVQSLRESFKKLCESIRL